MLGRMQAFPTILSYLRGRAILDHHIRGVNLEARDTYTLRLEGIGRSEEYFRADDDLPPICRRRQLLRTVAKSRDGQPKPFIHISRLSSALLTLT
jgi:hypothetical protein